MLTKKLYCLHSHYIFFYYIHVLIMQEYKLCLHCSYSKNVNEILISDFPHTINTLKEHMSYVLLTAFVGLVPLFVHSIKGHRGHEGARLGQVRFCCLLQSVQQEPIRGGVIKPTRSLLTIYKKNIEWWKDIKLKILIFLVVSTMCTLFQAG